MTALVKSMQYYFCRIYLTDVKILLTGPTGRVQDLVVSAEVTCGGEVPGVTLNKYSIEDVRSAANQILLDQDAASVMVKKALLDYAKKKIDEDFVSK